MGPEASHCLGLLETAALEAEFLASVPRLLLRPGPVLPPRPLLLPLSSARGMGWLSHQVRPQPRDCPEVARCSGTAAWPLPATSSPVSRPSRHSPAGLPCWTGPGLASAVPSGPSDASLLKSQLECPLQIGPLRPAGLEPLALCAPSFTCCLRALCAV